jgi:bilirubin oxidase
MKKILFLAVFTAVLAVKAQNTLAIPPVIDDPNINLTLQNSTYQFFAGHNTATMGVNGAVLGPTLVMHKNTNVNIHVTNNLGQQTTLHWHGMHISAVNDGGPHTIIEPGTTWNPQFTVMNNASTMWYHPHLDTHTDEHVSKGIAGLIIIKDDQEASLDLPRTYGVDDIPLVVQTKDFDANYQIVNHSNNDDTIMVNATVDPVVDLPAQVVRLRLLNGSTQRVFRFGFDNNRSFYQIATDGGLRETPLQTTRLQLASGERSEILVDLSGLQGQTIYLKSYASEFGNGIYGATSPGMNASMSLNNYNPNSLNGSDFTVLTINVVAQTANPVTTIPATLTTITPYLEADSDASRSFDMAPEQGGLQQLNGNFIINGVSMDMNTINVTVPLNNTEIWTVNNNSAIAHPFHIHDIQFLILDINGNPPPATAQGWKDTYLVPAGGGSMRVITKFEDFADDAVPYMYHCHMLTHEDGGMMGQFVVVDPNASESDKDLNNGFVLFPNPSNQVYMTAKLLNTNDKIKAYAVINELGQIIQYHKIHPNEVNNMYSFPVFELASGKYMLRLFTDKQIYTKAFIKE